MKVNGNISGDLTTGQKIFMARQWAALIGLCGIEIQKKLQNIWKQIEKARDATEVRTIVFTTIKEQQVDVNIQSSQVRFGENVVEDI